MDVDEMTIVQSFSRSCSFRHDLYKLGHGRSLISMQDIISNLIDRVKEPFCNASSFISEQANCDVPGAIPAPDFIAWKMLPINDDQKLKIKTPLCDAMGAAITLLDCKI